jgi:hypothetical protein
VEVVREVFDSFGGNLSACGVFLLGCVATCNITEWIYLSSSFRSCSTSSGVARTGSGAVEKPVIKISRWQLSRSLVCGYVRGNIFFYTLRSFLQAKRAEGNLHASLLRDADRVFWTRTMWTTEEAMKSFMLSGAHRQVMPRLLNWCNEAALVHWEQESQKMPEWDEAHRRLK